MPQEGDMFTSHGQEERGSGRMGAGSLPSQEKRKVTHSQTAV